MSTPTNRNSIGSQLPLPTSITTSATPLPQLGTIVSTSARPTSPSLHSRGLPHLIHRPPGESQSPNSPTSSSFAHHLHSTTHAGGIQPSMSFFRPARPSTQMEYSRPNSVVSAHNIGNDSPEPFSLGGTTGRFSESFDEHADRPRETDEINPNLQDMGMSRRPKHSREPLIPMVERPNSARPSMVRERSGTATSFTPRSIIRTSFDRVMGLSRGLSIDSIRKSTSSRPFSADGRRMYDGKAKDEEDAYELPASPNRYKRASSPDDYNAAMSLDHRQSTTHTSRSPSPELLFDPSPPQNDPPLSAVPIINPNTKRPYRRYELHPSNNKFFLRGRLLTGGDSPWAFIFSFLLVLGLSGVWFGTTCVWWWKNESPAVAAVGIYMALLVISTMLATATTDPGILPRDLDPDPPYSNETPSDGPTRTPMPRDLKVRDDIVRTKYCPTCRTYRPPRSSHCKMCDNCVDGCDHHCQWVNNCVGRRNYTTFFVLLLSTTSTLVLIVCTSALHLYLLTVRENINFRQALQRGAGSAVAFCLSITIIWPVAALLTYHMRLLLLNITTIEQIRNQAHKSLIPDTPPPNPFSHGSWRRNVINVLCRPPGYSWLDASAVATEDKREVNPGMVDGVRVLWESSEH